MTDPADLHAATQYAAEDEHNAAQEIPTPDPDAQILATDQCASCDYMTAPVGAPCPECGSLHRVSDRVITWNTRNPDSLAVSLLGTDWEALNEALPGLARRMVHVLRVNAQEVRDGRVPLFRFDDNDPNDVADIAELSQRLFTVFDVVGRFAKEMQTLSKEALAEIAIDAESTKLARVVIPSGPGGPTIVAARERTVVTDFDDARILAVIAELSVLQSDPDVRRMLTEGEIDPDDYVESAYNIGLRAGAKYGAGFAVDMRTNAKWKITALKALAADALANGKFRIAAVINAAFKQRVEDGDYKVTVEHR